jgi:hypothetical protein
MNLSADLKPISITYTILHQYINIIPKQLSPYNSYQPLKKYLIK